MRITTDDLSGPEIPALLAEHLRDMYATSPAESVYALDLDGLRQPAVTVYAARADGELLGIGALKELEPGHGEIKSMRTAQAHRRKGVAAALLDHIVGQARARGMTRLSLETGTDDFFAPARALYARRGFLPCPPFVGYTDDPNSTFMTLTLPPLAAARSSA